MTWRFVNGMTNLIGMGFTVPHGTVMSSYIMCLHEYIINIHMCMCDQVVLGFTTSVAYNWVVIKPMLHGVLHLV